MNKEDLIKFFKRNDGRWNSVRIKHISDDVLEELIQLTSFLNSSYSIKERLVALEQNHTAPPICLHCGKELKSFKTSYCNSTCFSQTIEFKNSQSKRNLADANAKRKETMKLKYGVEFNSQRPEFTPYTRTQEHKINQSIILKEKTNHFDQQKLNLEWILKENKNRTLLDISNEIGCSSSCLQQIMRKSGFYAKKHFFSKEELIVRTFLDSLDIEYETNIRFENFELDIFIKDYHLAIEINGLYWHSEQRGKTQTYHLNKTERCKEQGIELLHFWDFEINYQFDIVSSMILAKLGKLQKRIFARNCDVFIPNKAEEKQFFNTNHRQGYVSSSSCFGLKYNNRIIAMMSFGKPRFNRNFDFELLRFSSSLGYSVVGGASRLFKQRPEGSIITYADRRYSSGKVYEHLGFSFLKNTKPNYWYTKDYNYIVHRSNFQKHKLTKLESFDQNLSEKENMEINGFDRVWDCGNLVFVIYK